jgi:hypothetical protein
LLFLPTRSRIYHLLEKVSNIDCIISSTDLEISGAIIFTPTAITVSETHQRSYAALKTVNHDATRKRTTGWTIQITGEYNVDVVDWGVEKTVNVKGTVTLNKIDTQGAVDKEGRLRGDTMENSQGARPAELQVSS